MSAKDYTWRADITNRAIEVSYIHELLTNLILACDQLGQNLINQLNINWQIIDNLHEPNRNNLEAKKKIK